MTLSLKYFSLSLVPLLLYPLVALAQVASQPLFGLDSTDNPAAITTGGDKVRVLVQSSSGTGVFNENVYEREKYKTTSSAALLTIKQAGFGIQLKLVPTEKREINEVTEYSRITSTVNQSSNQLGLAYQPMDLLGIGVGFQSATEKIGNYQVSQTTLKLGGVISLPIGVHVGLMTGLSTYSEAVQETRSRFEPAIGVGWILDADLLQLRLETSMAKAPEVFRQSSTKDGPGYLRAWSQSRLSFEAAYNLIVTNLALGWDQRSRTYTALESGNDETESENTMYLGSLFTANRFGVFISQTKQISALAKHQKAITNNRLSLALTF